jgi:hypothetical protein
MLIGENHFCDTCGCEIDSGTVCSERVFAWQGKHSHRPHAANSNNHDRGSGSIEDARDHSVLAGEHAS